MAVTIISSELEIYSGAGSSIGQKVGNSIITQGDSTSINVNYSTLGVNLSAGSQYSARARCTNSDEFTSDWSAYYSFKTLANALFADKSATSNSITFCGEIQTTSAVQVVECGFYYSTSETGVNATKVASTDIQGYGQPGVTATNGEKGYVVQEHTTYYMIPYCIDSDGREFKDDWANAEEIETPYSKASITNDITTTYNSVTGDYTYSSTTSVTEVSATLQAVGGGDIYVIELDPNMTSNTFTFTDGDEDSEGNTIVINPNTEYRVVVNVVNLGGRASNTQTATTQQQQTSSITITSVTNITPRSAVVNLSFGTPSE